MASLVVLSGRIGSGKTTLAQGLEQRYGMRRVRTRDLISRRFGPDATREALQRQGEKLDKRTKGRWLADDLGAIVTSDQIVKAWLIDSARRLEQIEGIRAAFGVGVVHIHLTASVETLDGRFQRRRAAGEAESFAIASADPTEAQVETLAEHADILINTERTGPDGVLTRAAARLGLFGSSAQRLVDVLVGGQYGSEGKGHIASYLAREYDLLVRVGGPNAGHKVMLESGEYTHHILPSGTRTSEARLLIGAGAVLRVPRLLDEIADCEVDRERLTIDPQAMIISDEDVKREAELMKAIGSTGQGVGAATARKVFEGRYQTVVLAKDVPELRPFIGSATDVLSHAYAAGHRILVEGTQGIGLSLHHGSYPYVTSRDTSTAGTLGECGIPPSRVRRVVMVVRTYPIRVQNPPGGTSGPMGSEITWRGVERRAQLPRGSLRPKERTSTTNRQRRVAEFDWVLLQRASLLDGPTDIALSFVDYIAAMNKNARRFEQLTDDTIHFIEEVEAVAQAPVSLISTRFHERSVIDRRNW
jgi:adenylosuccinate synthase